jgi:hypothetical protein
MRKKSGSVVPSRVNKVVPTPAFGRGDKTDRFSMNFMVRFAARAGLKPKLKLAA